MSGRVQLRGGSHLRRGRSVRRASARLSLTRIAATAVLLAVALALSQLSGASAFTVRRVDVEGAAMTDRAQVEAVLVAAASSANIFRYDSAAAAARLAMLPTVRRVAVRTVLPDLVVATLSEREPVLAWSMGKAGDTGFLVDADGLLFADLADAPSGLVRISDLRTASTDLVAGDRIAAVELRVARELAALTPTSVGSKATALDISVTDADGFVVSTEPAGWSAVFGVYGDVVRNPDLVPLQVQCLASLLAKQAEKDVGRVVLSPDGQLCGTFAPPGRS